MKQLGGAYNGLGTHDSSFFFFFFSGKHINFPDFMQVEREYVNDRNGRDYIFPQAICDRN